MTNEQAIAHFKEQLEVFGGEHHEAMKVAIEALKKQIAKNDGWTETCLAIQKILIEHGVEPLGKLANAIFDAVPQYGWIPASEPPKEEGEYLCTLQGEHNNGTAQQCGFIPKSMIGLIPGWSTCDADGFVRLRDEEVVAWMSLPKPYEAGE